MSFGCYIFICIYTIQLQKGNKPNSHLLSMLCRLKSQYPYLFKQSNHMNEYILHFIHIWKAALVENSIEVFVQFAQNNWRLSSLMIKINCCHFIFFVKLNWSFSARFWNILEFVYLFSFVHYFFISFLVMEFDRYFVIDVCVFIGAISHRTNAWNKTELSLSYLK